MTMDADAEGGVVAPVSDEAMTWTQYLAPGSRPFIEHVEMGQVVWTRFPPPWGVAVNANVTKGPPALGAFATSSAAVGDTGTADTMAGLLQWKTGMLDDSTTGSSSIYPPVPEQLTQAAAS